MYKKLSVVLLVLLIGACAAPAGKPSEAAPKTVYQPANRQVLGLGFPADHDVLFLGKITTDQADNLSGSMAYPGYDAASFLAAIIAHAAAQGAVDAQEEHRKREAANKVLEKYQAALSKINRISLVEENPKIEITGEMVTLYPYDQQIDTEKNLYVAEVDPVFYVAQNERSLVLSNRVLFKETKRPNTATKRMVIEYVSSPYLDDNPTEYWSSENYKPFISTSTKIFRQTIRLALEYQQDMSSLLGKKNKTIRYYESGKKKVERGHVIEEYCDRIVFLTLRQSIKSVPVFNPGAGCKPQNDVVAQLLPESNIQNEIEN